MMTPTPYSPAPSILILDPPTVPADDRGLLLGDGLFETIRLYAGRPFRLSSHLDRMGRGGTRLGILPPPDLRERVERFLGRWPGGEGALRITLTRGSAPGLIPESSAEGQLYLQLRSLTPVPSTIHERGIRVILAGTLSERALTVGIKTLGYSERIEAALQAVKVGAGDALLRNSANHFAEGAASNLIGVIDGGIVSPGESAGALPGITREILLNEARKLGMTVEERGIGEEKLSGASELFLTSSLREIVPVTAVEDRKVGSGEPGPVYRELRQRFRAVVEAEVGTVD